MSEEESTHWLSSGIEGRSQGRLRDFFYAPVLPTAAPLASSAADYTWVMNPVDGVSNLLHGIEHASVSFALLWRGFPILGVIADVFGGRQYMAAHGEGIWIQDERLGSEPQPLPALRQEHLSSSILTFALPEDAEYSGSVFRAAAKLFSKCQDLRHQGVPSLDLVNVAAGATQGHFQRGISTALLAPAAVILREAGVQLTDWSGESLVFPFESGRLDVAAGRDPVVREMLDVLVKIRT
ncbi:inositol monophosphatase family protein [Microbacterium sp. Bi128]|uniref:inositol monophosphatase family protein n=1 Tax=Microbacterium sp. Bi128 TaxID=2821115 RepID=UPI001E60C525|nr:inositol monophosphatase family protein [Microbacterium sp. Bi128]